MSLDYPDPTSHMKSHLDGMGTRRYTLAVPSPVPSDSRLVLDFTLYFMHFILFLQSILFFIFSGNRRAIRCRSAVFETSMGVHQFDSVQHHR